MVTCSNNFGRNKCENFTFIDDIAYCKITQKKLIIMRCPGCYTSHECPKIEG
jgi:hypothetical protein